MCVCVKYILRGRSLHLTDIFILIFGLLELLFFFFLLLNKRALVCYEDNYGRSKRHWVVKKAFVFC